jgi:hypothetical protein
MQRPARLSPRWGFVSPLRASKGAFLVQCDDRIQRGITPADAFEMTFDHGGCRKLSPPNGSGKLLH